MADYMVRGTAANDQIRAFAIISKDMVQEARTKHQTAPVVTAALGRSLSAAAMMGSMMKGDDDLMTLQFLGDGPIGGITVTADSHGHVKGFANNTEVYLPPKSPGHLDVGRGVGQGSLRVIKDLGLKEPYVGTVDIQTGEIGDDLTYYFAASEQVPSSVGLGVLVGTDNEVITAGGFIIQLMPFTEDAVIDQLEKNLSHIKSVTEMLFEGMSPEEMLAHVLEGFDLTIMEKQDVSFRCDCSRERVEKTLFTLRDEDIQSMIDDGEAIEVKCHFCNTAYNFTVEELKGILAKRNA